MITGRTRIIMVVGDPISAARAPEALNAAAAANGLDVVAVPAEIAPADLNAFVTAARGWKNLGGLVVTMPHKRAIAPLLNELTERAQATGVVNVVHRAVDGRLIGDQLDGEGFVSSVLEAGIAITGNRIALLGAGGVARSIAFSLAEHEPSRLRILNRSVERADELVSDVATAYPALDVAVGTPVDVAGAHLLVNATSVGSVANPGMPVRPESIATVAVVADVVANPERTALLQEAERLGVRTHSGVRMQEAQLEAILGLLQ